MKTKEFENVTNKHSDAKIIDFKDYTKYNEKLLEIMELARALGDEIYDSMFQLACLDKWKKWDESQPIGAEINVTDDMLRNTGDKNIDLLWQILDKIMDVEDQIRVIKPKVE